MQIVVHDPIIDRKERQITSATSPPTTVDSTTTVKSTTIEKPPTTAKPTTTSTTPKFIGGHSYHSFNITCKNIPKEGVKKTVVHVFQGKYVPNIFILKLIIIF